jgi:acetyl-CoA C-acetyltransferase
MNNVSIIGVGQTPVGEHWDQSLRALAVDGIQAALADAGTPKIDALVVGNALGGIISGQHALGAMVADFAGMRGTEAIRVEAADASGGAALRYGYLMVASGAAQTVLVLGVEKVTDSVGSARGSAMLSFTDSEYEGAFGTTPVALAALLMRRYMHEYGVTLSDFAGFSVNAHANGSKNVNAMFRNLIKADRFASAPVVADPVNLFDAAPEADGSAAVVLTTAERAADMVPTPIRILASAVGTDAVALHDRADLLFLLAANLSAGRAYAQAGIRPADLNFAELHDSSTILSTLALEAIGFAERGQGWRLAAEGQIVPGGRTPMSTFGGLKARGNPFGATGIYQAVEAVLQLRGQAGALQLPNEPQIGMIQNIGGLGSTAITHILGR